MSIARQIQDRFSTLVGTGFIALSLTLAATSDVYAGTREQAKRIHDRIAGVPPSNATLKDMTACLDGDAGNCSSTADLNGAVSIAMQNKNFYNVTLKNMITPWTNEERSVFDVENVGALNDYTALVIGIVRDNADFREILYTNKLYVAGPAAPTSETYSTTDNLMYKEMEENHADLSQTNVLALSTQVAEYAGTPSAILDEATAGVMTTRQGARAFFYAGTNRAMFRFTMLNHLCNDLEGIKDITRPNDRIHQDVTRSPGGDSRIFLNGCIGCHAGMDGMMGAFAYYDWVYDTANDETGKDGHLVYYQTNHPLLVNTDDPAEAIQSRVAPKFVQNFNNFIYGHITKDDSWVNYWRKGPNNDRLGWGNLPSASHPNGVAVLKEGYVYGHGAKQLGQELANSQAFAECQVKKVYRAVCHGEPTNSQISEMRTNFTGSGNYQLKSVFTDAISRCLGP